MLNRYIRFHENIRLDWLIKLLISLVLLMAVGPIVVDTRGMVPISLQTLFVLFGAIAFGWQIGAVAVLIYIVSGVLGLPVFANYTSGSGSLAGPFGGFFFGFLAASVLCGFLAERDSFQKPIVAVLNWLIGHTVILVFGTLWLIRFDPNGWQEKIEIMLPGALAKSVIGALVIHLIVRFYTKDRSKRAFED